MFWIIFESWLVHPGRAKTGGEPFASSRDNWWSFYSACTMHLITPPLPFGPLPLRSDCSQPRLYFNARVFIFHPALPSPPRLLHPVPYPPPRSPYYSPQTLGFVYYRGVASEKLSTLRNPRDFHFIRNQLPLNIFIRRLIILRGDARSPIACIYGAAAFCR